MTQTPSNWLNRKKLAEFDEVNASSADWQSTDYDKNNSIAGYLPANNKTSNSNPTHVNSLPPKRSSLNLRQQLLLAIMPVVLIPIAAASIIGYRLFHQDSEAKTKNQLQSHVLIASEVTKEVIEEGVELSSIVATNNQIIDAARELSQQVEWQNLNQLPIETLEESFERTKLYQPNQDLNDYLRRVAEIDQAAEIIVTESHGLNIAATNLTSDFVQQDEQWWQKAKVQSVWISPLDYDLSAETEGFSVSQAITQPETGQFLGVVKTTFPISSFNRILLYLKPVELIESEKIQLFNTSDNSVINTIANYGATGDRQILGGETVAAVASAIVETSGEQILNLDLSRSLVEQYGLKELNIENLRQNDRNILMASFRYEDQYYVVANIAQTNLAAITCVDHEVVEASGNDVVIMFLWLALAIATITTAVIWYLSKKITAPLNQLVTAANQVSAGNLNARAPETGSIETKTLARSFNALLAEVKNYLQNQRLNTQQANIITQISGSQTLNREDLENAFNQAVIEAKEFLGVERVIICRINQDDNRGVITNEAIASNFISALQLGLSGATLPPSVHQDYAEGKVLVVNDVTEAEIDPERLQLIEKLQVKAMVAAPIVNQKQLYGLLIAHDCSGVHQWQNWEVNFLSKVARQLGLIAERVLLLEQERIAKEERVAREQLQRRVLELLLEVDPVSQGDLTVRAKVTEDEIGTVADSYNATIESLRRLVTQVKQAATQVQTTALKNNTAIEQLSTEAVHQAQTIWDAVEKIQIMTESIRAVNERAKEAETAVEQANQTVIDSESAMSVTVDGIVAIKDTVAETAEKVKHLNESSQSISQIVALIGRFAAQTHLLALKASIEAARAGEQGQGFAVIADEVRSLAAQSAAATNQIETIVAKIQLETADVLSAMETGQQQVGKGTQLIETTRDRLSKITAASVKIDQLVKAISTAASEQGQTSEAVAETIAEVALIAEQNSASASEVSLSFKQLLNLAQELQQDVGKFKVDQV